MADLPRFYAEARSEITVMERIKEAADAIGRQFKDHEPLQNITGDEALDLAEVANAATDDGFDWEVIDRTRKPLSRVICRTNSDDAMMIAEALNATVRDTLTNDKGETLMETMNRVRALPR